MDHLASTIMLAVRQHKSAGESVALSRRVVSDFLMRAQQGKLFTGPKPPFGYEFKLGSEGDRVGYRINTERPQEVEVVKFIFDSYANRGKSVNDIANCLNERGLVTPRGKGRWRGSTLYGILTNPVYCGDYCWGKTSRGKHQRTSTDAPQGFVRTQGKKRPPIRHKQEDWYRIENSHEALIPRELFDAVQARRVKNQRNTAPSRKHGRHLVSGRLVCTHCGGPMYGTTMGGRDVYRCGTYSGSKGCKGYTVREDLLLVNISHALKDVFLQPENLNRLRQSIERQAAGADVRKTEEIETLRRLVTRLENQIAKARGRLAFEDDDSVYDDLKRGIRQLEQQRTEARSRLSQLESTVSTQGIEQVIGRAYQLVEVLQSADKELVRTFLATAVERVDCVFEIVKKARCNRYPWREGVLHLAVEEESLDLPGSRPGRG